MAERYFRESNNTSHEECKENSKNGANTRKDDENTEECDKNFDLISAKTLKSKGNEFYKQRKYDQARESYSSAIKVCPKEELRQLSIFYQNRAAANEKLERWSEVIEDCTAALQCNHGYVKALYRRSHAYEMLGDKRSCFRDSYVGTCWDYHRTYEKTDREKCNEKLLKSIAEDLLTDAIKNRVFEVPSVHVFEEYIDIYNYNIFKDVQLTSSEAEANYGKILQFMKQGNFEKVLQLCDKEIDAVGRHKMRALLLRGTFRDLMSDHWGAIADITEAKELAVQEGNRLLEYDALLRVPNDMTGKTTSDLIEMYTSIDEEFELGKLNATVKVFKGRFLRSMGRYKEAKQTLSAAVSLDPTFLMARIQYCLCLYEESGGSRSPSLSKEAEMAYISMIRDFPNSSQAFEQYSTVLENAGRFEEANKMLDMAMCMDPTSPRAYVAKGMNLITATANYEEAEKLLLKAFELDARHGPALRGLGILEEKKENYSKSLEYMERAVQVILDDNQLLTVFIRMERTRGHLAMEKSYSEMVELLNRKCEGFGDMVNLLAEVYERWTKNRQQRQHRKR